MTTLGGFLAVQTLSLLLLSEMRGRTIDPDPSLVLLGLVLGLVGLALCGAGLPLLAHGRRVRKWRQRYLLNLQDARAWFVQGRIAEADLETVRRHLEEAAEGRFPGEVRRTSGDVLRRTGLFVAGWCVVAGLAAWRLDAGTSRTVLAAIVAIAALAAVALLARGWPLWKAGKVATTAHLAWLAEQERWLLGKARERSATPETT